MLVETLGASRGLALPSVSGQRGIGLLHMGRLGLITPPDHPHMGKGSRAPPDFTYRLKSDVQWTYGRNIQLGANAGVPECSAETLLGYLASYETMR